MSSRVEGIHPKSTAKAKNAAKCLQHYLDTKGDADGWPRSEAARKDNDSEEHLQIIPAAAIREDEFLRLSSWLTELAIENKTAGYAALLQVWLDSHNIPWPADLFRKSVDFSTTGPGRQPTTDGTQARSLRAKGHKWQEIGLKESAPRYKTKAGLRKAADRVRKRAERYDPYIDLTLKQVGHSMLGTLVPEEAVAAMNAESDSQ